MDDAASSLFLAGLAAREAGNVSGPVLWASCRTGLYAPGPAHAGLLVTGVMHAQRCDDQELLAVVEDAVRDGTPSAVTPVRHLTNTAERCNRSLRRLAAMVTSLRCACYAGAGLYSNARLL
jgi:protein ImuA